LLQILQGRNKGSPIKPLYRLDQQHTCYRNRTVEMASPLPTLCRQKPDITGHALMVRLAISTIHTAHTRMRLCIRKAAADWVDLR
jgi:hypothetical protein